LRVYFDVCCYSRPFDDLTHVKVRLEAEAVLAILGIAQEKGWVIVSSDVAELEVSNIANTEKRIKVIELCSVSGEVVTATADIAQRADNFQTHGIKALDSFHLALAESAEVDVLISTDDKFVRLANKLSLSMKVINPLEWLSEVLA